MSAMVNQSLDTDRRHSGLLPRYPHFASLLIGICDYRYAPRLQGPINDVNAVEGFLKDILHIQTENNPLITILRDSEATRERIIESLRNLANAPLPHGSPILIYYAGHGGEALAPHGWEAGRPGAKIQNIIAQDSDFVDNDVVIPEESDVGHQERETDEAAYPIPDRTVNSLLNEIAEKRGNNILVIFDCCHSGSGTRQGRHNVRGVTVTRTLPFSLDQDIWGASKSEMSTRKGVIPSGFLQRDTRSHVLLAACNQEEAAQETKIGGNFRGVFTVELLKALQAAFPDVTYRTLIKLLPKNMPQSPQCEGLHQDRLLFSVEKRIGHNCSSRSARFSIMPDKTNTIIMQAGTFLGVRKGGRYIVYQDRDRVSLGELIAIRPEASFTIMQYLSDQFPIEAGAVAEQVGFSLDGSEHVHVSVPVDLRYALEQDIGDQRSRQRPFVITSLEDSTANVTITTQPDGQMSLRLSHTLTGHPRFESQTAVPVPRDSGRLNAALHSAAHFFWYLNEEMPSLNSSQPRLRDKVKMEFFHAREIVQNRFYQAEGEDLCHNGVVDLVVCNQDSDRYIIKLWNHSDVDLHVHLFMFNPSDLSIELLELPASSNKQSFPKLRRNGGSLVIGTGVANCAPLQFTLDDCVDRDISFLKLFLSSEVQDISWIQQAGLGSQSPIGLTETKKFRSGDQPPLNDCRDACEWITSAIIVNQIRKDC